MAHFSGREPHPKIRRAAICGGKAWPRRRAVRPFFAGRARYACQTKMSNDGGMPRLEKLAPIITGTQRSRDKAGGRPGCAHSRHRIDFWPFPPDHFRTVINPETNDSISDARAWIGRAGNFYLSSVSVTDKFSFQNLVSQYH